MLKKCFSILLAAIIVMSVFSALSFTSYAEDTNITDVGADYDISQTGASRTQAEAVAWTKQMADSHWAIRDGSTWTQCTEFVWQYYEWLLGYHVSGHAYQYLTDLYGACPYSAGWSRPSPSTAQPGDIVIWDKNKNFRADWTDYTKEYGHIGIIVSVSGNSMVTVEANAGENYGNEHGVCGYKYNREVSCISGLIRPAFLPSTPITPSATFNDWTNDNYTFISSTNAAIGQEVITSGGSFTQVGMILYNANGTRIGSASDTPTSGQTRYFYNINNELGCTLNPNTTYKYQFYAVVGGQTFFSSTKSFNTGAILFNDWWNDKYTYISTTDASIGQEIIATGSNYTQNGMILYNAVGEQLASVSQASTAGYTRYYFKINEELHYTLTPGTTYKYKFFAVVNGTTYYSEFKTFKTNSDAVVNMNWNNNYILPSSYNAYISVSAIAPATGTFSSATLKVWDSKGTLVASKTEDPFATTKSSMSLLYDVYSETSVFLERGTAYTYCLSVTYNGRNYDSPTYSFTTEGDNDKHFGIDVSSHQGYINWDVAAGYIDYAIIRCGYGSDYTANDDSYWEYNVSECERLGIPYGVYLYSYAENENEAKSEADHLLRLLKGHSPTLPVYYDLEDAKTVGQLSNAQISSQAKIFCDTVEAKGYNVGIYANFNWWNNKLTTESYNNYSKWIAVYSSSRSMIADGWKLWQYSSSSRVPGISGAVDVNYSNENIENKIILGDVDGDGEVTIIDATCIQRKLASIPTANYNKEAADVDNDGEVTIIDATCIQRYLVQLPAPERIGTL